MSTHEVKARAFEEGECMKEMRNCGERIASIRGLNGVVLCACTMYAINIDSIIDNGLPVTNANSHQHYITSIYNIDEEANCVVLNSM